MSSFWSAYIIILTVITIIATTWLLFGNRTRPADSEGKTGHVFDGIEEYDNPLPAWWFHMFVITIVFAIGYSSPTPDSAISGLLGWTQLDQWQREQPAERVFEPRSRCGRTRQRPPQAMGQRIFANNCPCHGADGAVARPNCRRD
jgi:cytochrome c oxidase cbb3-type subunit 3